MERGKYLTDEEKRLIIRLYEIGKNPKELAVAFNRSVPCIRRIIAVKDTFEQDLKAKKEKKKSPLTKKQEEAAIELIRKGKSDSVIEQKLGIKHKDLLMFMNMPRKDTKSYTPPKKEKRGKDKPKKGVSLIPCPFIHCSDRVNCKEIEEPQQCPVWKIYQKENLNKRWGKQAVKAAIKKPKD